MFLISLIIDESRIVRVKLLEKSRMTIQLLLSNGGRESHLVSLKPSERHDLTFMECENATIANPSFS